MEANEANHEEERESQNEQENWGYMQQEQHSDDNKGDVDENYENAGEEEELEENLANEQHYMQEEMVDAVNQEAGGPENQQQHIENISQRENTSTIAEEQTTKPQQIASRTDNQLANIKPIILGFNQLPIPDFPKQTIIPELPMRNNEVYSQYKNRKQVYENVMKDLKDHEKAVSYSNIWFNMFYLKNRYSKSLEDAVAKYSPI